MVAFAYFSAVFLAFAYHGVISHWEADNVSRVCFGAFLAIIFFVRAWLRAPR
jgi:hypothetical protein